MAGVRRQAPPQIMSDSKRQLEGVFWLGGSPCSGKSSISEIIASRFGLDVYHVDGAFESHAQRFDPLRQPALTKWSKSSWNQRWMQPVESLVQDVIACYREHFALVLEDIFSLPKRTSLLVEGTALLPAQVASVLSHPSHAIWLIPTADFQRAHYSKRDWVRSVLAQCSEPEVAFHNWMERDIRFARWIEAEASATHLSLLRVDGNQTIEQKAEAVGRQFQLVDRSHE
jgi:2-phosphoglycerate kinase